MSPAKKLSFQSESAGLSRGRERGLESKESYHLAAQATSAAEWNSLLIWARRQRGPQWDAATATWQVDAGSSEYYSFCSDPARQTKLSKASEEARYGTKGGVDVVNEGQKLHLEGIDSESQDVGGYSVEDSPPIGPGGRRSRAR
ncbi:hypothetical protein CBS101457_004047 [Exobasidium rhododendri]|nr:hypothetical protein CBS101457_004047 [Exobasidium rhododendri]